MYACKLGIRAALTDISNNHPNDLVSLIMFSVPCASANDGGRFNRVARRLEQRLLEHAGLAVVSAGHGGQLARPTVTPYDSNNLEVPRAYGGTCYSMGLMLAYNQFSGNTSLRQLQSRRRGRRCRRQRPQGGAENHHLRDRRCAEHHGHAPRSTTLGPYNSYYTIRYNSSSPGSQRVSHQHQRLQRQCLDRDHADLQPLHADLRPPTRPARRATRRPPRRRLIHCIGFGPVIAPAVRGSAATIATLNQMQTLGNVTDGMPSYKIIYGSGVDASPPSLQQAFTQILQSGVQISLIQ